MDFATRKCDPGIKICSLSLSAREIKCFLKIIWHNKVKMGVESNNRLAAVHIFVWVHMFTKQYSKRYSKNQKATEIHDILVLFDKTNTFM